ncbi:MAG: asparagine synthase (glutamine-hydrolyzing) [Candidatus Peribacteraceae bacterium]|jgi:asparagine synthase (glutamine-hydrolysing)
MCGIAGIIRLNGETADQGHIDRLTDALSHRGPDSRGTFIHGNAGLGFRRLSILDLTPAGNQPMVSDDGQTVVVFNGEIYNFAQERAALESRGHRFRSRGDTEVLLHLYAEYGEACLEHLRGMFAFAILDLKRGTLFLARDRVGKKPLKFFATPTLFAFASELKALRTLPECPREVDEEAMHHFLTMMYLPAPLTGFRGIEKLPAAHAMRVDLRTGERKMWRYWELSYEPDDGPALAEWQERIRKTFDESVRLRMVADVPVGAFLSGGVDSAAVVASMSGLSDRPIKTFSIGSEHEKMNELPGAAVIAKKFGTDHHPIMVEPDIVRLLPELVATYEEPYADPSSIPTYLIARESRRNVTVALNGDGGDENFAGYIRYPILRFSERWHQLPSWMHALVSGGTDLFHRLRNDTFSYRVRRFQHSIGLPFPRRYLQYLSFFTEEEKQALYKDTFPSFPRTDAWYEAKTEHARSRGADLVSRAQSMDLETYLADDLLPKVDLGSMAHGLEARSPFLDHALLELTARIPVRHKVHGRVGKWILKDMLRNTLPTETLWEKKRGFRLPLDLWFRGELSGFVSDRLLTGSPAFWRFFDRGRMERFLVSYRGSSVDYSDHVWALLWLEEWLRSSV